MSKRRKKGIHKNSNASPTWATRPTPNRLGQYGTHRTAAMEDRREARIQRHMNSKFTDEDLRVERPCARGTVGCSIIHRTGYERCEERA